MCKLIVVVTRFLSLCAVLLALPGVVAAQGSVTLNTSQGPDCKPAFFIGLRGSGESAGKYSLGDTVRVFYNKFKAIYGKTNVDVHGVPYPAIKVPDFAASNRLDDLYDKLRTFGASVAEGVTKLSNVLIAQHATCPDQKFVIVGYSQGAWVTGEVLAGLDPTLLSQVAAVVLLGDPKLWWRDPDLEGIATKFPQIPPLAGFPGGGGPRQPRYMPGMTDWMTRPSQAVSFPFHSYCYAQDPICNATRLVPQELLPGFPDTPGTTEWKTWLYFCQNEDSRNPVFCQHFMYDKGSFPEEVANWFVERLSQGANIPAAPSDLSLAITSGGTGIGVSWKDNSDNEAGFDIGYNPVPEINGIKHLLVGPNQTFLSSDWGLNQSNGQLLPGQTMCFQVSAYNAAGSSAPTPWGCITVP
jgi:hypothetical protein